MNRRSSSFVSPLALVSIAVVAVAVWGRPGTARAEETDGHPVGVGYKIGNGIGFLGADVVVRAIPHLALDLQANYLSEAVNTGYTTTDTATGYGLAPTLQFQFKTVGHTPYIGLGFAYVHLSLRDATGTTSALLVNFGYEWRFASGVGVMVGGGIADIGGINVVGSDGTSISASGGVHANIEAGVRYYFGGGADGNK